MTAALKPANQFKIQLTVVKGPHVGQVFHFEKAVMTIGRGPENDIMLVNDPLVSRAHARIDLIKNEFELVNLSDKNSLLVHGESTQKSILVNDSTFQVGDSEIKFQFDLGKSVVSVPPKSAPPLALVKNKAQPVPVARKASVAVKPTKTPAPLASNSSYAALSAQPQFSSGVGMAAPPSPNTAPNKRVRFYAIIGILVVVVGAFLLTPSKNKKVKAKPLLKYEDEVAVSLNSKTELEAISKRKEEKKANESPTKQRAEENFIKGMRDFQLGNYARAEDFFRVVLNLVPDHPLARRHLYLSKVRFDELVQAKLVLGESYYQKHNFSMCESMYQQVQNMLIGKSSDQNYKLAERMIEKCQLAAEGIR